MNHSVALVFIWALIFAIFYLPARKVGPWIARFPDGLAGAILSILHCFALAWCVVLAGWVTLKVGGHWIFPHVKTAHFGLPYVAALLLIPSFAVLIAGYLRARKDASRRTLSSFIPAKIKDLLADLGLLIMGVAFLGFSGQRLLGWYETGKIAVRYRELSFAAEPYIFVFAFFMFCLLAVVG